MWNVIASLIRPAVPLIAWEQEGFRLRLYDHGRCNAEGAHVLSYELLDNGRIIFRGNDFHRSPIRGTDGLAPVYSLLGFLSLQASWDPDYFDHYTPEQLAWRDSPRCERLAQIVRQWRESTPVETWA